MAIPARRCARAFDVPNRRYYTYNCVNAHDITRAHTHTHMYRYACTRIHARTTDHMRTKIHNCFRRYMHACIHTTVHTHPYTHEHMCIMPRHACTRYHARTCVGTCIHTCIHTAMCALLNNARTHTSAWIHTYTYTHNTYTHVRTHTHQPSPFHSDVMTMLSHARGLRRGLAALVAIDCWCG